VHGQWRSISATYTHLHDTPNSKQLFTNPTAILFSTLIHWTNPYTDQAWEPDWTRIGPPWPLSDKPICLTKLLPTQTILASSFYKNYCWTFPWQSYQLVCVVRPTTPTTADKNLLCPLIRQTIVWVFMAVPNGVTDNTLRNDFFLYCYKLPRSCSSNLLLSLQAHIHILIRCFWQCMIETSILDNWTSCKRNVMWRYILDCWKTTQPIRHITRLHHSHGPRTPDLWQFEKWPRFGHWSTNSAARTSP